MVVNELAQFDGDHEVDPGPEQDQLQEGWDHQGHKVEVVPIVEVLVNQDLHCPDREELQVFALGERFDELTTFARV